MLVDLSSPEKLYAILWMKLSLNISFAIISAHLPTYWQYIQTKF